MRRDTTVKTQCRELCGPFQQCRNPLCDNRVEPKRKHAAVKHYCSGECTQTASIIRIVAALLGPVERRTERRRKLRRLLGIKRF